MAEDSVVLDEVAGLSAGVEAAAREHGQKSAAQVAPGWRSV